MSKSKEQRAQEIVDMIFSGDVMFSSSGNTGGRLGMVDWLTHDPVKHRKTTCKNCEKEFPDPHRSRKYCSRECWLEHKRGERE